MLSLPACSNSKAAEITANSKTGISKEAIPSSRPMSLRAIGREVRIKVTPPASTKEVTNTRDRTRLLSLSGLATKVVHLLPLTPGVIKATNRTKVMVSRMTVGGLLEDTDKCAWRVDSLSQAFKLR